MNIKLIGKTTLALVTIALLVIGCAQKNDHATEANTKLEDHLENLEMKMEENANWVQDNWEDLEVEFNELKKEIKDEKVILAADAKWDSLTTRLETWVSENTAETQSYSPQVMSAYSVLGIESEHDMITSVDKLNIDDKYRIFVDSVEAHKKEYNLHDWNRVELVWDALNVKKEELEPLETTKELEIAKQKTRYAGIKAFRKTDDKVEEVLKDVK